jgi:hypothetical protein
MGHALMENRNGLIVDACVTQADGHVERIAALHVIEPRADRPRPVTLGADKAGTVRNLVFGAIVALMEGEDGDQEGHVGSAFGGPRSAGGLFERWAVR